MPKGFGRILDFVQSCRNPTAPGIGSMVPEPLQWVEIRPYRPSGGVCNEHVRYQVPFSEDLPNFPRNSILQSGRPAHGWMCNSTLLRLRRLFCRRVSAGWADLLIYDEPLMVRERAAGGLENSGNKKFDPGGRISSFVTKRFVTRI